MHIVRIKRRVGSYNVWRWKAIIPRAGLQAAQVGRVVGAKPDEPGEEEAQERNGVYRGDNAMIALSAHRAIMQDHAWKATTPTTTKSVYVRGASQPLSKLLVVRRYKARKRGIEPPLEYGSLDKALEAIGR